MSPVWTLDGDHSFTSGRMQHATFKDVVEWIDMVWHILSGFQKTGVIEDHNVQSDDSTVVDMPVCLPLELAEFFNSDMEEEDFEGFAEEWKISHKCS